MNSDCETSLSFASDIIPLQAVLPLPGLEDILCKRRYFDENFVLVKPWPISFHCDCQLCRNLFLQQQSSYLHFSYCAKTPFASDETFPSLIIPRHILCLVIPGLIGGLAAHIAIFVKLSKIETRAEVYEIRIVFNGQRLTQFAMTFWVCNDIWA